MSQYKISKKRLAEIIKEEYESLLAQEIDEGYMDALDRSRDEEDRERRRQMQRIRDEDERNSRSGRTGVGTRMGGSYKKKRFAGFNRKDEELKGGQKELDTDDDGDIDAEDMAALRAKKKKPTKESVESIRQMIKKELQNL
jgi:hypothetical protein